eukprot:Hpha_TRINITY_DN30369_c0_g1::TRINITY_DN30369_c0_g1_i1::g.147131::m.147131
MSDSDSSSHDSSSHKTEGEVSPAREFSSSDGGASDGEEPPPPQPAPTDLGPEWQWLLDCFRDKMGDLQPSLTVPALRPLLQTGQAGESLRSMIPGGRLTPVSYWVQRVTERLLKEEPEVTPAQAKAAIEELRRRVKEVNKSLGSRGLRKVRGAASVKHTRKGEAYLVLPEGDSEPISGVVYAVAKDLWERAPKQLGQRSQSPQRSHRRLQMQARSKQFPAPRVTPVAAKDRRVGQVLGCFESLEADVGTTVGDLLQFAGGKRTNPKWEFICNRLEEFLRGESGNPRKDVQHLVGRILLLLGRADARDSYRLWCENDLRERRGLREGWQERAVAAAAVLVVGLVCHDHEFLRLRRIYDAFWMDTWEGERVKRKVAKMQSHLEESQKRQQKREARKKYSKWLRGHRVRACQRRTEQYRGLQKRLAELRPAFDAGDDMDLHVDPADYLA